MELLGKEFNEEDFYNTYNGRPNDMLCKACEAGYAKGVIKAFELGADEIKGTFTESITRYGCYSIFFPLMCYFDLDYVDFFRKYKMGDEIPSELKGDVYTALFGLARIGLDFNELLDAFYGWLFTNNEMFEKDINDPYKEPEIYMIIKLFEPISKELRRYALRVARSADNNAGIDYLNSLDTENEIEKIVL